MQTAKSNEELLHARYVYLDWNVIKYMKDSRPDKGQLDIDFKNLVFKLKHKYKFPCSIAHIKDRATRYSPEHKDRVQQDLEFVKQLSDLVCVGFDDKNQNPVLGKLHSIQEWFDSYVINYRKDIPSFEDSFPYIINVDMTKVSDKHPMYDILKKYNGKISDVTMSSFLQCLYETIFVDASKYKNIREHAQNMDWSQVSFSEIPADEEARLNKLLFHLGPFLHSFKDDKLQLKSKWKQIAEKWFSLNNPLPLQKSLLLIQGYTLLDLHPLFKEKLKKGKNTLDNILRDGQHCFFASKANYFVSEDEYTRNKATFLYEVYGEKVKVVDESGFMNCFS